MPMPVGDIRLRTMHPREKLHYAPLYTKWGDNGFKGRIFGETRHIQTITPHLELPHDPYAWKSDYSKGTAEWKYPKNSWRITPWTAKDEDFLTGFKIYPIRIG